VVYKINLFVNRITKLLLGIVIALVVGFLFVKNNNVQESIVADKNLLGNIIQRSVDTTSSQIQRFIKTINPIK
jgi:hypothetical protein